MTDFEQIQSILEKANLKLNVQKNSIAIDTGCSEIGRIITEFEFDEDGTFVGLLSYD